MEKRGCMWLMTGVILTAGIVLSALGITFIVQNNNQQQQQQLEDLASTSFFVKVDAGNLRVSCSLSF